VNLPNNIKDLVPTVREPRIHIALPRTGSLVVLIRVYAIFSGQPYRVVLNNGDRELSDFTVFQSESFLLTDIIPCSRHVSEVDVSVKTIALDHAEPPVDCIRVNYVGAFML
jgi:hypothetical protein